MTAPGLIDVAAFFQADHAPAASAAASKPSASYLPKRPVRIGGTPLGEASIFILLVFPRSSRRRRAALSPKLLGEVTCLVRRHARLALAVERDERLAAVVATTVGRREPDRSVGGHAADVDPQCLDERVADLATAGEAARCAATQPDLCHPARLEHEVRVGR